MLKYIVLLLVIAGCNRPDKRQSLTLVTGLSENPDERRFGLEITPDTLFYCLEKKGGSETYDYFYTKTGGTLYSGLSERVKALFVHEYTTIDVPDAMP